MLRTRVIDGLRVLTLILGSVSLRRLLQQLRLLLVSVALNKLVSRQSPWSGLRLLSVRLLNLLLNSEHCHAALLVLNAVAATRKLLLTQGIVLLDIPLHFFEITPTHILGIDTVLGVI